MPTTGQNIGYKGEKPPVMPIAATRHTADGAKAFARFFVQTIDWGYVTTNSAYMRHYYTATCGFCSDIRKDLDTTDSVGHHYLGDRFTLASVEHLNTPSKNSSDTAITVKADVTAFTSVDARGKIFGASPPILGLELRVYLKWVSSKWTTVYMVQVAR